LANRIREAELEESLEKIEEMVIEKIKEIAMKLARNKENMETILNDQAVAQLKEFLDRNAKKQV